MTVRGFWLTRPERIQGFQLDTAGVSVLLVSASPERILGGLPTEGRDSGYPGHGERILQAFETALPASQTCLCTRVHAS